MDGADSEGGGGGEGRKKRERMEAEFTQIQFGVTFFGARTGFYFIFPPT